MEERMNKIMQITKQQKKPVILDIDSKRRDRVEKIAKKGLS